MILVTTLTESLMSSGDKNDLHSLKVEEKSMFSL